MSKTRLRSRVTVPGSAELGLVSPFESCDGVWNVVKALLTVMSPLIADWVLKRSWVSVEYPVINEFQQPIAQFTVVSSVHDYVHDASGLSSGN